MLLSTRRDQRWLLFYIKRSYQKVRFYDFSTRTDHRRWHFLTERSSLIIFLYKKFTFDDSSICNNNPWWLFCTERSSLTTFLYKKSPLMTLLDDNIIADNFSLIVEDISACIDRQFLYEKIITEYSSIWKTLSVIFFKSG